MTDKSAWVYSQKGWRERVQLHPGRSFSPLSEDWQVAGELAADVLGWPTQSPSLEPWASRISDVNVWKKLQAEVLGATTDEDRLHAALGVRTTFGQAEQERLEYARGFAETYQEAQPLRVRLPMKWVPLGRNIRELGDVVRLDAFGRDEQHFFTTPAAAVYLSAVLGFARETLRLCEDCARFVAFPREGFQRKYCDDCRARRGQRANAVRVPRTTSREAQEKLKGWRRVSARIYRRILREDQRSQRRSAKRLTMRPKARAQWQEWRLLALNALRDARDLDEWEATWAPDQKRGPKSINP